MPIPATACWSARKSASKRGFPKMAGICVRLPRVVTPRRTRRRVMPGFTLFSLRAALVASLFLVASMSGPLAQQRVGVHSAVNPDVTGAPPGATPRRLVIGQDAVFNEHITTAANGQTQVLFLDQSSMTIGPNSDLTIDQFVY